MLFRLRVRFGARERLAVSWVFSGRCMWKTLTCVCVWYRYRNGPMVGPGSVIDEEENHVAFKGIPGFVTVRPLREDSDGGQSPTVRYGLSG